jgi:hypothetical protein
MILTSEKTEPLAKHQNPDNTVHIDTTTTLTEPPIIIRTPGFEQNLNHQTPNQNTG